jgi:hypothetical protein
VHNALALPINARPRRRGGVHEFAVGEELILFVPRGHDAGASPSVSDRAVTLNGSGREIWELCNGHHSVGEILARLDARHEGGTETLRADLSTALFRLRTLDLIDLEHGHDLGRPPIKFVVGVEDKIYFHWQLPILFESLHGRLPPGWEVCVVVCNGHQALSEPLLRIVNAYNVKFVTGRNLPDRENMDFANGQDRYVPINRIEALAAIAPHVAEDDLVCLTDTDVFLYGDLNVGVFPTGNLLTRNWIVDQDIFFSFGSETEGVKLPELLASMGYSTLFQGGGVCVFLSGATIKNEKFIKDCFRFTQILYLMGSIIEVPKVWIAEMPCYALSLTANNLSYEVADIEEFTVGNFAKESIPSGTFYHYYHDLKDGGDGAFAGSKWHKQLYFTTDLLTSDLERYAGEASSDHERYFFELANRARERLDASDPTRHRGAIG